MVLLLTVRPGLYVTVVTKQNLYVILVYFFLWVEGLLSILGKSMCGFVVDKLMMGQIFSNKSGFTLPLFILPMLHPHLSLIFSCTIGQSL